MDTRLKIIITVFAIIVVFYFFQFLFGYMKKKEHFTSSYYDDVEHYENSDKVHQETDNDNEKEKYELRIFLLDEIDKLNITDKIVKGNIMETLFSDTSMDNLSKMSKEKRIEQVKNVYQSAVNVKSSVTQETVPTTKNATHIAEEMDEEEPSPDMYKKPFENQIKQMFKGSDFKLPNPDDYLSFDHKNRENQFNEKYEHIVETLTQMKELMTNNKPEPKIPHIPQPLPMVEEFTNSKAKTKGGLIEGFENIKEYATY